MNVNRMYNPRTRVSGVTPSNYPPTNTVVLTRQLKHIKPDAPIIGTVDPDGFRRPAPWNMEWSDGDVLCVGSSSYGNATARSFVSGPQNFGGTYASAPTFPGGLAAQAEVGALKKLSDIKIDIPVTIAERRQTANMLYDSCARIGRAFGFFRRRKFKRAMQELGLTSLAGPRDHWLAYRYGWTPLLSDVYSAMELIQEKDIESPKRLRTHVTCERKEEPVTSFTTYGSYYKLFEVERTWHRCFVRFDFGPPPEYMSTLKTLDEFGVLNPARVAWELMPYSFVIDWFIPVGDWLSSLGLVPFTFRGGSRTEFTTRTIVVTASPYNGGGWAMPPVVSARQRSTAKKFRRVVYPSFPFPSPSAILRPGAISTNLALIGKRCLDGIALLSKAFAT